MELRDALGRVVTRSTTGDRSHFMLIAPAGRYKVQVDLQGALLPRCETIDAVIRKDRMTAVQLACDSGMR